MSRLRLLAIEIVQTLFRVLPFPCPTGLLRIGNPGRDSPILLTCNFRLTVERVRRALRGVDAYLLVANSRGVNVWCAATGGLLTDHDVVSVLRTSGIEAAVDHRWLILPQLAATGIEARAVQERTGWRVVWGPVEAEDVPAFLARGLEATPAMRSVRFPWPQRLEMAVAWAAPISLVIGLVAACFWGWGALWLVGLVWALALAIFAAFPLYERRLRGDGARRIGFVFFDFGRFGLPLVLWGFFLAGLLAFAAWHGELNAAFLAPWGVASLAVLLILTIDLAGSTPLYKSGLHEDRRLRIELDEVRCKGAAFCERVCPTRVFWVDPERRMATLPRADACVQCGACIVQCPFDALFFRGESGGVVPPETVRRFKLDLIGRRIRAPGPGA
jgi:NAD-dependent dihydropyrimidine dehydrogenase PreA subunit